MKPLTLILFLELLNGFFIVSNAQTIEQLSKNYIEAYFEMNPEVYGTFLDEEIVWADPTWSEVDPENIPVIGKSEMINHLRTSTSGITEMSYVIDHHFTSGNIAVFEGFLEYGWKNPNSEKIFYFKVREVSVLEFNEKKKIKRHTDYTDFRNWLVQYQKQM